MTKLFLKDAWSKFVLENGKNACLMANLDLMVEDVKGKPMRLANEQERVEISELIDQNNRLWAQIEMES